MRQQTYAERAGVTETTRKKNRNGSVRRILRGEEEGCWMRRKWERREEGEEEGGCGVWGESQRRPGIVIFIG